MITVVLGMHKSGTTLVARLLHESGIHMGEFDERLDYGSGNKYERREAQDANRTLLRGYLLPPLDHLLVRHRRPAVDAAGYPTNRDSQAFIRHRALARFLEQPAAGDVVAPVVEACERAHPDWGFKDPRTCLTYPAWRQRLPDHRIVVVFRGLSQVLQRSRTGPRHPLRSLRVLHAWTVYNWMIWRHLETTDRPRLVLRYEELMTGDSGLQRLSEFVGRPLHDARDARLYRSRSQRPVPGWVDAARPLLPFDPREIEDRLGRQAA